MPFWNPSPTISQLPRRTETRTIAASDIPSERAHDGSNPRNTPETQAHPTGTISFPNPKLDNTPPAAQRQATTHQSSPNNLRIVPTSSNPTCFAYHVSRFRKIRLLTHENLEQHHRFVPQVPKRRQRSSPSDFILPCDFARYLTKYFAATGPVFLIGNNEIRPRP